MPPCHCRSLLVLLATLFPSVVVAKSATPAGTAFTYQGQLKLQDAPVDASADFQFRLYDAETGGAQVGTTVAVNNVTVVEGLFTVELDFGVGTFDSNARWLEITVRSPAGSGNFVSLAPRQALRAAPYALFALSGNEGPPGPAGDSHWQLNGTSTFYSNGNVGIGTSDPRQPLHVEATADTAAAVFGHSATTNSYGYGVRGVADGQNGAGVYGQSNPSGFQSTAVGVLGRSREGSYFQSFGVSAGVMGLGGAGFGVAGASESADGIYGEAHAFDKSGVKGVNINSTGAGVFGESSSGTGVRGRSTTGYAGVFEGKVQTSDDVFVGGDIGIGLFLAEPAARIDASTGFNTTTGTAIRGSVPGEGALAYGLVGRVGQGSTYADNTASGVLGTSPTQYGVHGKSGTGSGVVGASTSGYGVVGRTVNGPYAGYFVGNVHVQGTLTKNAGAFKIDHPLDPANKYLSHSFVESPDMMNIYNGNVVTDDNGYATVRMPEWFEALNHDFRYQLTVIGDFAQVAVAETMKGNLFVIRSDKPRVEISWQVTGVRHDPFAEKHRIPVEEEKSMTDRGRYIFPEGYGQPASSSIGELTTAMDGEQ